MNETPLPLIFVMASIIGIMLILMGLLAEIIMRNCQKSWDKPVCLVEAGSNLEQK